MIKKGKNTLLGQMFFFVLAAAALMSAAFFMTFQYIRETAAEHTSGWPEFPIDMSKILCTGTTAPPVFDMHS